MTAVTAGTSKTFTAQVDGSAFVVIAPGGAVGSVIDQNGNTQAIDPNGTRRTFGPLRELQSITVSMQIGNASVELNGWSGGMPITAETNSSGQTVLDDASRAAINLSAQPNAFGFSMIGDSRTDDLFVGTGTNSRNWFNQACAYYKQTPVLVGEYGVASKRSDEYLTNGNFELALADSAQFLIFGYPAVNDIGAAFAGYTDTFGRAITLANVASMVADNIITYAKRAVAYGKKVIILTEPGSTTHVATQVAQVHEFNRILKTRVAEVPGAILYDPCPILWNPTSSSTLIGFRTNYSGDGTHAQQIAARAVGLDFATNVLPAVLPKVDTAPASTSDTVANGTNQLFRNPLFSTLTGGVTGGNITLSSGTVPANVTISGSAAATLAVTITSASNAQGFGNDVTFAFTWASTVNARIDLTTTVGDWNLTDQFESRIEMDIAAGSTAVGVHTETLVQTNAGTNDLWGLYSANSGPMSTAGDTGLVFRTRKGGVVAGSVTKTAVQQRIQVTGTGAGACTITLRRPGIYRYA